MGVGERKVILLTSGIIMILEIGKIEIYHL